MIWSPNIWNQRLLLLSEGSEGTLSQLGFGEGEDMLGTWVGDPVQPKGLHEMNTRRHTRSFLVRSQGSGRSFPGKMQASGALEGSLCK